LYVPNKQQKYRKSPSDKTPIRSIFTPQVKQAMNQSQISKQGKMAVCFSAPHSQAAEEAIPRLYKQERKRPTPVRSWLSRTQAVLGRVIPIGYRQ